VVLLLSCRRRLYYLYNNQEVLKSFCGFGHFVRQKEESTARYVICAPCPDCPLMILEYFEDHLCAGALPEGGK